MFLWVGIKMLMSTSECLAKYGNYYRIAQAIRCGELHKITHGVYSDSNRHRCVEVLLKKYPTAVVTMFSAYYYYGLTDNVPSKIHLAVERDGTKIRDVNVVEYFVPKGTGDIGVANAELHGIALRIFDKERLLIETVRLRNKLPIDLYHEVIGSYRKDANALYPAKIEDYLDSFPHRNIIFDAIKKEVL